MNMKKLIFKGFVVLSAAVLLTDCMAELESLTGGGEKPIGLTVGVDEPDGWRDTAHADTRAGTSVLGSFTAGDVIAVGFSGNTTLGTSTTTTYQISNASTGATTCTGTQPYFTLDGESTTAYGYYPSKPGSTFSVQTSQSSDADYKSSDLMYASVSISKSNPSSSGTLTFAHKMAKIIVNATASTGVSKITDVRIVGGYRTISLTDATTCTLGSTLTNANSTSSYIIAYTGGTAATANCAALIPPQTVTGDFLQVVTDQGTVTYSLSGKTFASGQAYTFDVSINAAAIGTTVDLTDWTTNGTVTVNPTISTGGDAPTLSPTSLSLTFRSGTGSITPSVVGTAWTGMSANTSVATVSGTGPITVTPAGVGSTTIYVWPTAGVSSGFSTASCPVTVSALTMQTSNSSNNGYTTFSSIADQLYTGSAITPTPTVTVKGSDGNVNLVSGTDFDYSYSNNTAAGTNTATVTVTGKGNYTGSASKTFSIVTYTGTALSSATVGQIICSHGKAHAATTGALSCGGTKVAVVGYKSGSSGYAIALVNSTSQTWNEITNSGANKNVDCTLADGKRGSVPAAPTGTTWKVLNKTNYEAMFVAMGSTAGDKDGKTYDANVNNKITAAGGTALSGYYWSTSEISSDDGWGFTESYWNNGNKARSHNVRPVLAW